MIEPVEPVEDRWGPWRARLVAGALGLVFAIIVGRAAQVALGSDEGDTHKHARAEPARRADIVDRHGDLLATTLPGYSLAANPSAIWDAKDVATRLAAVLPDLDVADLTKRLSDRDRQFTWVQRGLTPKQRKQVFDLGLEGLRFQEERIRIYPGGHLAGHLLGFANIDGQGIDGVERVFNDRLAKGGEPLKLTIDSGVQFALEAELDRASETFTMEGAAGIVVDASNGAVRAIASWPPIDPNHPTERSEKAKPNRAMNSVFELGSIYKPLTVAAALDAGQLTPTDTFDVSSPIKIGAATIHDEHVFDHAKAVTPTDIIAYSSNVGAVQIGQRLGPQRLKAFLDQVGLLGRPSYEGPQSAAPLTPAEWDPLTSATVSFGHGIAVTPLSFAMSYVPFANGGNYLQPLFLEPAEGAEIKRKQVVTPQTVREVIAMMRQTVLVGTGKLADAPGYEVAGKTGTAEKPGPDGYDPNANITSFAAVFPASRPQFVVLVVLDNAQPKVGDQRTAAYTSASIVGRLVARAAPLLDVHPVLARPADAAVAPELRAASESRSL
jgi:cell division protein FtsI (penicillin-binding protein 3)